MKLVYLLLGIFALKSACILAASLQNKSLSKINLVDTDTRIIDAEINKKDVPYIVSIGFSKFAHSHICAGAIIGKEWVLTAAHCIENIQNIIGVTAGFPVTAGSTDRENGEIYTADFSFSHKDFSSDSGDNDVALLHITPPFKFSKHLRQITLPYLKEDNIGDLVTSYGWGYLNSDADIFEKKLHVARGIVLTKEECLKLHPRTPPNFKEQICVKIAACHGDGGSPLVVERPDGGAELVGLTSWGYLPCGAETPTMYTAVSEFLPWITKVQSAYYTLN